MTPNEIPSAAVDAVKGFLKCAWDEPDEAKARTWLCKASLDTATFQLPPEMRGAKYDVGAAIKEGSGIFVPVTITDAATGRSQTLPFAPVLEEGSWKLDMGKMMEKLMGGVGGAMGQIAEQMGSAMGEAMKGIGEAMAGAMGAVTNELAQGGGIGRQTSAEDLKKLEKKVAEINGELSGRNDLSVRVEVDARTLLRGENEAANSALVRKIVEDVLRNFVYAVTEAHREIPFEGRVKVIRLEGVREARDRAVYAEGARIIYRLAAQEEEGFYDGQTLARLFVGVAAGMEETAPPGEVEAKPSYRPTGDGEKIVRDYQEFVVPRMMRRMAEMLDQQLRIDVDWEQFAGSPDHAAALWVWGLNRICGAFGLLTMKGENQGVLKESIEVVRILPVPQAEMKAIDFSSKELLIYFSPGAGEAGGFYEAEIADLVSKKFKLRTRPMIAELERYAKRWETSLMELFREKGSSDGGEVPAGVSIQYAFDWDGFTCNDDENKNALALTRLRENGIDWMYYALASLVEKNPNFKQQLPMRVRWIYLEHAPSAAQKGIRGEQTTLALKIFLHEGYDGYLTPKELERALPGIVASMPDIAQEKPAGPTQEEQEELAELEELQKSEEKLAALREAVDTRLRKFAQSMIDITGSRLPVEVAWESFQGTAEEVDPFLAGALLTVTRALSLAGREAALQSVVAAKLDKVVLRQGNEEEDEEEGFSVDSRVLTFTAVREEGKEPMEPEEALELMREVLGMAPAQAPGSSRYDESAPTTYRMPMQAKPGEDPNERTPQPYVAPPNPTADAAAAAMKAQFEGLLPVYSQQFAMILGKPVEFEIEWASVTGGMEGMGNLLNAGLTPTVGGLAILASDPKKKLHAHTLISKVVLRQATTTSEHGFSLRASTLTYSAALMPGVPPMDPQLAAALLETVLKSTDLAKRVGAKSRAKAAPRKKPPKRTK